MKYRSLVVFSLLVALATGFAGCGESEEPTQNEDNAQHDENDGDDDNDENLDSMIRPTKTGIRSSNSSSKTAPPFHSLSRFHPTNTRRRSG